MYKTGHSLIKAKMKQEHAELAGEMSGHMFFADRYLGYDDALYAACRLIEIVAASGKPLSAQMAGLPKLVSTPEIRVDCPDEVKFQVVERVSERLKKTHNVIERGRGARALRTRLGTGARVEHATRSGDAFRSGERRLAGEVSGRDGSGARRSQGGNGLGTRLNLTRVRRPTSEKCGPHRRAGRYIA